MSLNEYTVSDTLTNTFSDLSSAVASLSATQTDIFINSSESVSANMLIPYTINAHIINSGKIVPAAGVTVTIVNPPESKSKCFDLGNLGSNVVFNNSQNVDPSWYGISPTDSGYDGVILLNAGPSIYGSLPYTSKNNGSKYFVVYGFDNFIAIPGSKFQVNTNTYIVVKSVFTGTENRVYVTTSINVEADLGYLSNILYVSISLMSNPTKTLIPGNLSIQNPRFPGFNYSIPQAKANIYINQFEYDTFHVIGYNEDTNHGVTDILPNQASWGIKCKDHSSSEGHGGMRLYGIGGQNTSAAEVDDTGIQLEGIICGPTLGGSNAIQLNSSRQDGTGTSALDATDIAFSVTNNGSVLIQTFGNGGTEISSLAAGGLVKAASSTGLLEIAGASSDYVVPGILTDWSGVSKANPQGFSAIPTDQVMYKINDGVVKLWFLISGSTSATNFSFTLPVAPKNTGLSITSISFPLSNCWDGGSALTGTAQVLITAGNTTANLYSNCSAGAWSATGGTKQANGFIEYFI